MSITPIEFDLDNLIEEFNLSKAEVNSLLDACVKEVTAQFARNWQSQAELNLTKTRNQFIRSIKVVDRGLLEGEVRLVGKLPNMVEQGCSPFDMKDGFSKSDKKVTKKDGGWYLTIPFRMAASTSLGESEVFSSKLPPAIHEIAKKLEGKDSLQLKNIPKEFQNKTVRKEVMIGSVTYKEYTSKSESIYEGLQKNQTEGHSGYVTFRRVSDSSPAESWIHTGIQAFNLADKAMGMLDIPAECDKVIDDFLDAKLK